MKDLIAEIKQLQTENKKLRSQIKKISEIVNGKQSAKATGSSVLDTLKIENKGISDEHYKR